MMSTEVADVTTGSASTSEAEEDEESVDNLYYKMVFVINNKLGMSPGKMGAQIGHAAIDLYQMMLNRTQTSQTSLVAAGGGADDIDQQIPLEVQLAQWNENGAKKVVLKCESVEEMYELEATAKSLGLPFSTIEDAGLTQIAPGSHTVFGLFGPSNMVDLVTGHLKLM